jgi:plastocyanin
MRVAVAIAAVAGLTTTAAAQPKPAAKPSGRVVGKVTVTEADGKPAVGAEVIVYITGFPEEGTKAIATVAQRDRKFVPDLVAITVGETVSFPNGDPFFHNVFSQSTARKFDLGSFKKDEEKKKDFPGTGVVDVYCNIHPEMAATILVLPNRRHASAGKDGRYVLDGVPVGKWKVFAYSRRATRPVFADVTVTAGADTSIDLSLVRGAEPEHPNKYGEKYHDAGGTYR